MKREIVFAALLILVFAGFASASCDMGVTLLNQDPYPATPGEYVKVVFQINGTETTECNSVFFDIVPEYPFSVESSDTRVVLAGGTYITGYESFLLKAYKLRVDGNALDGDSKIKVKYGYKTGGTTSSYTKEFDVNIKDARTDFEVSVQGYDAAKNSVTFGVINIGKYNAESLTLEVPEQDNMKLKGASSSIVGSLNSNDDTTASIEAVPRVGDITLKLNYNDQNNVRRSVEKKVYFSSNFLENGTVKVTHDKFYYMFWVLLVVFVAKALWNWRQRRKAKNNKIALLRR
jgi:hypothetical protein